MLYRALTMGKNFYVPIHQLDKIFDFYEKNPNFKRRDALACFFGTTSSTLIESISTITTFKNVPIIHTVEFDNWLDEHLFLHQILSKIDLGTIHEIKFRVIKFQKVTGLISNKKTQEEVFRHLLRSNISSIRDTTKNEFELNKVIKHLNTIVETENAKEDIDRCIDSFRVGSKDSISYTCLIETYDKILLWCRKLKRDLLTDKNRDKIRDHLFEKLLEENKELLEWILKNDISSVEEYTSDGSVEINIKKVLKNSFVIDKFNVDALKAYICHAMFIANKIRFSQRVPDWENKRKKAHQMWQRYIILKARKKSKKSQREIAEEVGVSLGTLNAWFKDFYNSNDLYDIASELADSDDSDDSAKIKNALKTLKDLTPKQTKLSKPKKLVKAKSSKKRIAEEREIVLEMARKAKKNKSSKT